jgi:hypothetical protein
MRTQGNAILATPIDDGAGRFYQIVGVPYHHCDSLNGSATDIINDVHQYIAALGGVERVTIETVLQDIHSSGNPTPTIATIEVQFSGVSTEVLDKVVRVALTSYTDLSELPMISIDQPIVRHYNAAAGRLSLM